MNTINVACGDNSMQEKKIPSPNFTQIPNVIFDYWMAILSPGAFKILLCMCRKTYGWHKSTDAISKNQLMEVTGMSKNSVQSSIEELEQHKLLMKFQKTTVYGAQPNEYALNVQKPEDVTYQESPEVRKIGGVGQNLTGGGQNLTPQKKDLVSKDNVFKPSIKKDNVKKTMSSSKDSSKTLDVAKRWRLTKPQMETFTWLQSQNINSDDGTIAYWCKTYSFDRLREVLEYSKKKSGTNLGGYITKLLKSDSLVENHRTETNKQTAVNFKKEFKFGSLKIFERYSKVKMPSGSDTEIPYNMDPHDFYRKLEDLFQIS